MKGRRGSEERPGRQRENERIPSTQFLSCRLFVIPVYVHAAVDVIASSWLFHVMYEAGYKRK